MAEPVTTIGIGAIAAYLGKDGLSKLLGPTADYLGGELKAFTQKRIENVGKIFKHAENKLEDRINNYGTVSPKTLRIIINEGSYASDELALEYLGGILACSRTDIGRDDRGARIAKQIDNLSCYQLRSHYLIYSTISKICDINNESLNNSTGRRKCQILIPFNEYVDAMELSESEWENPQLLSHIFHGLSSDGFITESWGFGNIEYLQKYIFNPQLNFADDFIGIVCEPTISGAELFLWGFGQANSHLNDIFDKSMQSKLPTDIKNIPSAIQCGK